jgi:hypothetical protein
MKPAERHLQKQKSKNVTAELSKNKPREKEVKKVDTAETGKTTETKPSLDEKKKEVTTTEVKKTEEKAPVVEKETNVGIVPAADIAEETTENFRSDIPPEENPNLESNTESLMPKRKAEELSAQPETKEMPAPKKANIEKTDLDTK